jgi:hypothetical protein
MINRKRIGEWIAVLRETKPPLRKVLGMLVKAIHIWKNPIGRLEWRRRMKACYECPVFDPQLKRCRPINTDIGCGCYTPYSNMKGNSCWGRKNLGNKFGWKNGE